MAYVYCPICSLSVNTDKKGAFEAAENVYHRLCYLFEEPQKELDLKFDPQQPECMNVYNCGHFIYGPPNYIPKHCPDCRNIPQI